ncbi:acyltransferase [Collinsella provencensis]|uniref:acyltransferase n=1 Tax=Collinsella provencensis TaxID=1937461 RepID=UPI000C84CFEB|nr:acyltransferase [Collinsella provencensis]
MTQRNIYMDVLSILSCMAVVYLHCSTVVYVNQGDLLWFFSIIVQSLFCFAVPVFFMISGANLIGYRKKYDTKTFLIKRLKRVAIPLVGFSALYYLLSCFAPGFFGLPARELSISGFVAGLFTNSICDVYWFLYAILALYFVTPLLSLAADDKGLLRYLLIVSFISTAAIPLVNRFAPIHTLLDLFVVPYLSGSIFLYLLGYYIERYVEITRKIRLGAIGVAIICFAIMAVMTYKTNVSHTVISGNFAEFDNFYINVYNIFCSTYSCAVFCLAKDAESRMRDVSAFGGKAFRLLSSVPFYVYLIHMLVIHMLDVYVPHRIIWDLGVRPPTVIVLSFVFGIVFLTAKRALKPHLGGATIINQ